MTGFDGDAHQRYLEAPYVDAARWEADFEAWCEDTGTDPEADNAYDLFADHMGGIEAAAEAEIDAAMAADAAAAHEEMAEVYDTESDTREDAHRERLARNTRRLLR